MHPWIAEQIVREHRRLLLEQSSRNWLARSSRVRRAAPPKWLRLRGARPIPQPDGQPSLVPAKTSS